MFKSQGNSPGHPTDVFTSDMCKQLNGMDPVFRHKKLRSLFGAYSQQVKGATGPSDAPNLLNRGPRIDGVFYPTQGALELDFGYEELFQFVDLRGSQQSDFDILGVSNLITFAEVKSGERMKKFGLHTDAAKVVKRGVSAAISVLDDWFRYERYWNLNQAAADAMSKYYDQMAADHYALITVAAQAQAFATDDITTINNACAQILADCAAAGYILTGNETFELRANGLIRDRIEKAFTLNFNSPNPDRNQLLYKLNRKYSTKVPATEYYVVLPGRKLQRGVWSDLTCENDRDAMGRATDLAYYGEYNAGIGEAKQVRKCALS